MHPLSVNLRDCPALERGCPVGVELTFQRSKSVRSLLPESFAYVPISHTACPVGVPPIRAISPPRSNLLCVCMKIVASQNASVNRRLTRFRVSFVILEHEKVKSGERSRRVKIVG